MYVCICNSVTDSDILTAAENGARSLEDLREELRVATCCGRCATCAKNLLRQSCKLSENGGKRRSRLQTPFPVEMKLSPA